VKVSAVKSSASTSVMHAKRVVSKAPLVVSEVRRCIRLKGKSAGFKTDACNPSKDCICCSSVPPTLSAKVIRSLGKDFCNIPLHQISEEALQKNRIKKKEAVVGQASRAIKKSRSNDDDKNAKNSKKQ
jgi:hypothetical protein